MPVTLLDNDTTLVEFRKRSWKLAVIESYAVQTNTFTELQELSAKKDTPRADLIAKAKEGAQRSAEDLTRLAEERKELFGDGQAPTEADRRDLEQAEQRLKLIREGIAALKDYVEQQMKIDKDEKSPERQQVQENIERGNLLERDGELGKAIVVYTKVLDDGYKDEKLEARVKQLRELWTPKSEEHRKARTFIYEEWPTLDTATLPAKMAEANQALAECVKVGDTLGPQKLYKGIQLHAARLLKEAEALNKVNEEDAKQLKAIGELSVNLSKLETDIKAFSRRKAAEVKSGQGDKETRRQGEIASRTLRRQGRLRFLLVSLSPCLLVSLSGPVRTSPCTPPLRRPGV